MGHAIDEIGTGTVRTLGEKVVHGGIWIVGLQITSRGLAFVKNLILARLLAPEDFGLFGIAMLALSTLETFSQPALATALIQKKRNVEPYLDTAWTAAVVRGFIVFAILYFSSPVLADFFKTPRAELIIRVIAVIMLLSSFENITILFFQKNLEFKRQFIYEVSAVLVNLIISLTLAFIWRNVWALVWGIFSAHLCKLIISYVVHPYRPRFKFSKDQFLELFDYSKWVLSTSVVIYLLHKGDDILVGKVLGAAALGFYQMAFMLSNLPATEISAAIARVTFPAYSKLQDNIVKLGQLYIRVASIISSISIPIAGLIFLLAPEFTQIFLGTKWMPMVPCLRILCIFGITRALNSPFGALFQGMGKPKLITKIAAAQLVLMGILVYPLTIRFGLLGTAIAVVIPNVCSLLYLNGKLMQEIQIKIGVILRSIFIPLTGMAIASLFVMAIKMYGATNLTNFLLAGSVGVLVYVSCIYAMDTVLKNNLFGYYREVLANV